MILKEVHFWGIKSKVKNLIPYPTLPFLLQARNSYSNEVVAIKKMSYNGKQTTEVRLSHMHTHTHTRAKVCLQNQDVTLNASSQL